MEQRVGKKESKEYGWKYKHERLYKDHNDESVFAESYHSHHSNLKALLLNADCEQRVDKQDGDTHKQEDDYVENQLHEQNGIG